MLNNTRTRKATTQTPEAVKDNIVRQLQSFCNRNGLVFETLPNSIGPVAQAVVAFNPALHSDQAVAHISCFYDVDGTASRRMKVLVTLKTWRRRADESTYDYHTSTASERSITQRLLNVAHAELNALAEINLAGMDEAVNA